MQAPDIRNVTMPGGIILSFDNGTGMRDLGYFLGKELTIEPKSTEFRFKSSRSGKLRTADIFSVDEEITLNFNLYEPVVENMQAYFKGGTIALVGAGTAAATDEKIILDGLILSSLDKYGISAVTVRQFLDRVLVYDGAAYTDRSEEADSLGGTAFALLSDTDEFVYFGKDTPFKELYFDLATNGSYTDVLWEYYDGATWQTLTTAGAADALDADGKVNWTVPADWSTTLVNNLLYYWIRVSAAAVTTPATCNAVRQNAVALTDYVMDPGRAGGAGMLKGRIGRLAGGFLADGEEVKVSYTYTTWSSLTFPVAAADFQKGAARLDFHPSTGLQGNYHIPLCRLTPNGKLDFDETKNLAIPMTLELLDNYLETPTAPFGYWEALSES